MSKRNIDDAVEKFLNSGGQITRLRYADQKNLNKANRSFFHKDKAVGGSARSKEIIEKQEKKESSLIFSREDRWKTD
jgi:hypothetical protein